MNDLPYAEKINYWKTGGSLPDVWINRARNQIEKLGGTGLGNAFGTMVETGRSAYMISFEIQGERFKIVWPVLPTKSKAQDAEKATQRQAATFLYHDIKARCLSATVIGTRAAFFSYLLLPDGMTAAEHSIEQVADIFPKMLGAGRAS